MASVPKGERTSFWKHKKDPHKRLRRTKEYNTQRWKKSRAVFIQFNPICVECKRVDVITPAQVVDHKVPVNQGAEFYDQTNWQSLCNRCHNKKSGSEAHS